MGTSRLKVDGSLWVVSTTPPLIAQVSPIFTNLILSGTGGTRKWGYYVLASADATLPPAQWTRVATNSFDASGNFTFTNAISPAQAQLFLLVQVQ